MKGKEKIKPNSANNLGLEYNEKNIPKVIPAANTPVK